MVAADGHIVVREIGIATAGRILRAETRRQIGLAALTPYLTRAAEVLHSCNDTAVICLRGGIGAGESPLRHV